MDKPTSDHSSNNNRNKLSTSPTMLVAVASILLSMLALSGAGYVVWQNDRISAETADFSQQLNFVSAHVKTENVQQQQLLERMAAQLKTLAQQVGTANTSLLAQVDYIVHVAQINLSVMHDANLALALLKKADSLLRTNGMTDAANIRQALAHDIEVLSAAAAPNLAQLQLRLDNLNQAIQKLPRRDVQLSKTPAQILANAQTAEKVTGVEQAGPWWQRLWSSVKGALSNVIILRQHQQPLPPLLTLEQQTLLAGNMQLKIAQAQWAIMRGEKSLYQASLRQLADWIVHYFEVDAQTTKDVLSQLQELAQINIVPILPDISASLQAVNQALSAQVSLPSMTTVPASQAPKSPRANPPNTPKSGESAPKSQAPAATTQPPAHEAIPL